MRLKIEEERVRKEQEEIDPVRKGLHLAKLFKKKARKNKNGEKLNWHGNCVETLKHDSSVLLNGRVLINFSLKNV